MNRRFGRRNVSDVEELAAIPTGRQPTGGGALIGSRLDYPRLDYQRPFTDSL